jgi:tetratricopeptide (TPR) repeat protein
MPLYHGTLNQMGELQSNQGTGNEAPGPALQVGVALTVMAVCAGAFALSWRQGFVNWDDQTNFIENSSIREVSWEAVAWAFTTRHMGHYQPINWLTFLTDNALFGLNPQAFHRTQSVLHGITAVMIFLLTLRLLERARISSARVRTLAAAIATICWGVHPLRVESVAWASARTDVLATLFYTAAVFVYVGHRSTSPPISTLRLLAVTALYVLALLSKVLAITLPVVLIVLDVYLGRLSWPPWKDPEKARRAILEKLPMLAIAVAAALSAFWAGEKAVAALEQKTAEWRISALAVGLVFPLYKTLVPVWLSPLYEYPVRFGFTHPTVILFAALFAVFVIGAILIHRKCPACVAAMSCYLIILFPVSGLLQRGPQMAADRYSYLATVPILVLTAAGISWVLPRFPRTTGLGLAGMFIALLALTNIQVKRWGDSFTLWRHAIALDPSNATAHDGLAAALARAEQLDEAERHYKAALAFQPLQHTARFGLANIQREKEQFDDAITNYLEVIRQQPGFSPARLGAGMTLVLCERYGEAEPHLRRLLEDDADHTLGLHLLADALAGQGRYSEAVALLDRAIAIARKTNEMKLVEVLSRVRREYVAESAASAPADR